MPVTAARPSLSRAARASLILALIALVGNVTFNGVYGAMRAEGIDAAPLGWVQVVVIAVLALLAIVIGARGVSDTTGGVQRGRGLAIAGIVIGILLVIGTVVLTIAGLVLPA